MTTTLYPTLKLLTEAHARKSRFNRSNHDTETEDPREVLELILSKCGPWITAVGGIKNALDSARIWRGVDERRIGRSSVATVKIRTNRRPRDTDQDLHTGLVNHIREQELVANRDNSIFATADYDTASEYAWDGDVYTVFPVGEFHYTWSPTTVDPTIELDKGGEIESIEYIGDDGSLMRAIASGHEIMIAASEAILIRYDMFEGLREALKDRK